VGPNKSRVGLLHLLRDNAFDEGRGTYIPLSPTYKVRGLITRDSKLFGDSLRLPDPHPMNFFANALLIPQGFGQPSFRKEDA